MNRDFLKQVFGKLENVDEAVMKEIIDAIMDENGKGINESKSKIDDLTNQLGLATKEKDEANKLIGELKKSNQGNEELQNKIGTYETQLNELKAENEQLKLDVRTATYEEIKAVWSKQGTSETYKDTGVLKEALDEYFKK